MSHSCTNLVSISFLYNPYIIILISGIFLFTSKCRETFVSKTFILFELYIIMYCYYNVFPEAIFVVYLKTTLFT